MPELCKGRVDSFNAGARDEIEVTPAMLAAGVTGLPLGDEAFNSEFISAEGIVERIYRAMVLASKIRPSAQQNAE
jgi:hypothetical protein